MNTQFIHNVRLSESRLYIEAFHNSSYGGGQKLVGREEVIGKSITI